MQVLSARVRRDSISADAEPELTSQKVRLTSDIKQLRVMTQDVARS